MQPTVRGKASGLIFVRIAGPKRLPRRAVLVAGRTTGFGDGYDGYFHAIASTSICAARRASDNCNRRIWRDCACACTARTGLCRIGGGAEFDREGPATAAAP